MGPNAWLWLMPVKTALGDGITFPTRIPLTECTTFHSIGELNFKRCSIKRSEAELQLQGYRYQVDQKPPVEPWSTRWWEQRGSRSSPCQPRWGAAWARTAGSRSPRRSRQCWSRTQSLQIAGSQKQRSPSGEKSQSESKYEVWECEVLCRFLNSKRDTGHLETWKWCSVVILCAPPSPCMWNKSLLQTNVPIQLTLSYINCAFLDFYPSLM